MAVTAADIIQDALELLGIYGPGDTISAADSARALSVLNDMMDLWSNDSLACFANTTQTFNLVVGISTYTAGSGGAIPGARPLKVMDMPGSAYLTDSQGNKYQVDVVDQMTWNMRTCAAVNSNLPDTLFYDPQFPLGIVNIWPTPSQVYACSFLSYLQLADFGSQAATFSLPPGYKRAITTNLAVMLKPYFTAAQLDPDVRIEAMESKGAIKRTNMKPQRASYDPELVARGSGSYNIRSDR